MQYFSLVWFMACACFVVFVDGDIIGMRNADGEVDSSTLSSETQKLINEQYEAFMKSRREEKEHKAKEEERKIKEQQPQNLTPNRKGISPMELNLKRNVVTDPPVTAQVEMEGGTYYFGTQMYLDKEGKIAPNQFKDGADIRKIVTVKYVMLCGVA